MARSPAAPPADLGCGGGVALNVDVPIGYPEPVEMTANHLRRRAPRRAVHHHGRRCGRERSRLRRVIVNQRVEHVSLRYAATCAGEGDAARSSAPSSSRMSGTPFRNGEMYL